ncbi:CocE/NonD family hydrolase, partial [Candidatus Heimdallarchaeota archaeon]
MVQDDQEYHKRSFIEKVKALSPAVKILLVFGMILIIATPIAIYFVTKNSPYPLKATYMVKMRDGIKLATDVYLPEEDGSFPFILFRTPYGKAEASSMAEFYSENGIGFISQDHRGCHASEGEYTLFGSDGPDAQDTINWMKEQNWFNGKVATEGGSARGITQYMQVPYVDDLQCQAITIATPKLYTQAIFQGGAPRKMLGENWLNGIGQGHYYDYLFNFPLSSSNFAHQHQIDPWEWGNVTWPSMHLGGWYDCFSQGIIDGYMGYQYHGGVGGKGNAKLIIGPWTHGIDSNPEGELQYPENLKDPMSTDIFNAMFAEKLLDSNEYGDYRTFPNVTYYVMGDTTAQSNQWNRWATSSVWPIPYTNRSYYLQPDQTLDIDLPSSSTECTYHYDPMNPVETRGGANLMDNNRGPYDQNPVEDGREDIIQFDYSVTEPLLVTGRITVNLFITSNCTDTDFTAKLMDVHPDGRSMLITDGIVRMRSRAGQDKAVFMDGSDSTIYECNIDLWSTSYFFNSGHKIRLSISSSNYPRF